MLENYSTAIVTTMSWFFYTLVLVALVTFNLFAIDSISKIRKDVSAILKIVQDEDGSKLSSSK